MSPEPPGNPSALRSPALHAALIILAVLACYLNSFSVPFQFDDADYILNNPAVRDPSILLDPSRIQGHMLRHFLMNRYVGFVSLWANFAAGGASTPGYHAVNVAVHLANALLLYALVLAGWRTPRMKGAGGRAPLAALGAALIFAAHPLMTQAVTYISQRFTSMAAMFYMGSLLAYSLARLEADDKRLKRYALYAAAFISGALAMKTKEIAITLPVALALWEFMLMDGPRRRRALRLAPFLLLGLIIPVTVLFSDQPFTSMVGDVLTRTRSDTLMPRATYLYTQFVVIVKYIGLLLYPSGLNVDHDQAIYASLANPAPLLSMLALAAMLGLGLWAARRMRNPLAAFGLVWFFLALSVESSILPIRDVMFEHRMYLPSAGLLMFISCAITRIRYRKAAFALIILVAVALSIATIKRNEVWQGTITLWEDAASKSPGKPRVFTNLGDAYAAHGLNDKAIESFQHAIALEPRYSRAYTGLGTLQLNLMMTAKAEETLTKAVETNPKNEDAWYNLGALYYLTGRYQLAVKSYSAALGLDPLDAAAALNLGRAEQKAGDDAAARRSYLDALRIQPSLALPPEASRLLSTSRP